MHWIVLVFLAEFVFGKIGTFAALAAVILVLAVAGAMMARGQLNLSARLEALKNPKIRRRMSTFEIFFFEEVSEVFETALPSLIFALFLGVWFSLAWVFAEGSSSNIVVSAQTFWSALAKAWSSAELSQVWKELPLGLLAHKMFVFGFFIGQFYRTNAVHKVLLIVAGRILEKARPEGLRAGQVPFFTEIVQIFTGPQLLVLNFKDPLKGLEDPEDLENLEGKPVEVVKKGEHGEERFIGDLLVAISGGKGEKEYADVEIAVQYHVADPRRYYAVRGGEKDFMASFIAAAVRAEAVKEHESLVAFFGIVFGPLQQEVQNGLRGQLDSWGISADTLKIQEADSTADVKKEEIKARAAAEEAKGKLAIGTAEAKVDELKSAAKEFGETSGFIGAILNKLPEDKKNDVAAEEIIRIAVQLKAAQAVAFSNPNIFLGNGGDGSLVELVVKAITAAKGVIGSSPSSSVSPAPKS